MLRDFLEKVLDWLIEYLQKVTDKKSDTIRNTKLTDKKDKGEWLADYANGKQQVSPEESITIRNPKPEKAPEPKPRKEKTPLAERRKEAQQVVIDFSAVSAALGDTQAISLEEIWLLLKENDQGTAKQHQKKFSELYNNLQKALEKPDQLQPIAKHLDEMAGFIGRFLKAGGDVLKKEGQMYKKDFMGLDDVKPLISLKDSCENTARKIPQRYR